MTGAIHVAGRFLDRAAAARIERGRLQDFVVAPPDAAGPAPGSVWVARAGRPAKGMGGGFADVGGSSLFVRGTGLREGRPVLVQVTGYGDAAKAAVATTRIALRGRFAVITPGAPGVNLSRAVERDASAEALKRRGERLLGALAGDTGLILRTAAARAAAEDIAAEVETLLSALSAAWARLDAGEPGQAVAAPAPMDRIASDWGPAEVATGPDAFAQHGVWDALRAVTSPPADSGALSVEPTRAFVAVDVNTGADRSPAAGLKANLAMADELPRVLRILGLGGQVVVDAAPMPKRDRRRVEQAMGRALRRDPVETSVAGWTPLGHLELNRQRSRHAWITECRDGLPDL